ncbi:hypothetical protein [Streptomyces sp. NPDC018031]|uniref:hypothetical protein n=1 Tax=Streptomyces sp. NPDC018031 TaxID=3365033 RepID=UPI0037AFA5AB
MSKLSDCEKDIRDLNRYAQELENALDAVKTILTDNTWRGPAGDRFREDWTGRSKQLRSALGHAKAEMERIRKKLADEEKKGGKD